MARMPSTRSQPLNPQVTALPVHVPPMPLQRRVEPVAVPLPPAVAPTAATAAPDVDHHDDTRAGGFHESSYELRLGLDISESEWPEDATVPGTLGPR